MIYDVCKTMVRERKVGQEDGKGDWEGGKEGIGGDTVSDLSPGISSLPSLWPVYPFAPPLYQHNHSSLVGTTCCHWQSVLCISL